MAVEGIVIERKHCGICNELLSPILCEFLHLVRSSYTYLCTVNAHRYHIVGTQVFPASHHFECTQCHGRLCYKDFKASLSSERDLDREILQNLQAIPKDVSHKRANNCTQFGAVSEGAKVEISPYLDDDEDASHRLFSAHTCSLCGAQGVDFIEHGKPFYCRDTDLAHFENCCGHCGAYFDPIDVSGCVTHPGVHELPVDAKGNPAFGILMSDIGGMYGVSQASARILMGRWSCCGRLCDHSLPSCPLFNDSSSSCDLRPEDVKIEMMGCQSSHHVPFTKIDPSVRKATFVRPECDVMNGAIVNGKTVKDPNWQSKIPWSTTPVRYPSGAPYEANEPTIEYQ